MIDDRTATAGAVAECSKTAEAKGHEGGGSAVHNDRATDFMAILTAIKAKKPDTIFYGGMDAQAGAMLRPDGPAGPEQREVLRR